MKKLIFLFAFCLNVTNIFAQTDPNQLKKEGAYALMPRTIRSLC